MNRPPQPPRYVVTQASQPKKRTRQTTFPFPAQKKLRQLEQSQPTGDWPPPQSQPPFSQFSQFSQTQNGFGVKEEVEPAPKTPKTLPLGNQPNLVVAVISEVLTARKNPQGGVSIRKHYGGNVNAHLFEILGNIISIDDQPSSGLIKFKIADESCPGQSLAVEFFPESEVVDNIIVGGAYRIIGRAAVEPKGVVFQCLGLFQCMDREEREFIRELGRK